VVGAAAAALLLTIGCWPTSRFVGINFVVSEQTLPLWAKAVDFVDRDLNLARTAHAVLGGAGDDDAKTAAALAWTRANIRNQPEELPVIDDHIWHIIIRGYGMGDQQADVFTTLLVYAGIPAYWMMIGDSGDELAISYVRLRGHWRVFDVGHGLVFRNRRNDLATPEELAADSGLITAAAAAGGLNADHYAARFTGYQPPRAPEMLRADMQMPRRRLWQAVRRLAGMPAREWQMRPPAAQHVQRTQP
jgi:hypothetical protein